MDYVLDIIISKQEVETVELKKKLIILCIGQYNDRGEFSTVQWEYYIDWCKIQCNKVIVYSHMSYDIICKKFSSYCTVNELEKPDKTVDVCAYEIDVTNIAFWDYIKGNNYNIDEKDDISHIYFFAGKRNVASLEIVDYENYVLIEEPIDREDIFLLQKDMILENIELCLKGEEEIEKLVEGESWRPLGADMNISPLNKKT